MFELAQHAGKTNGELIVPYADLVRRGMRRASIKLGLVILEAVGIIAARRDTRIGAMKEPTLYRLFVRAAPYCH